MCVSVSDTHLVIHLFEKLGIKSVDIENNVNVRCKADGKVICEGKAVGNDLYKLNFRIDCNVTVNDNDNFALAAKSDINVWHEKLGNLNFDSIHKMVTAGLLKNVKFDSVSFCKSCTLGKQHKLPHKELNTQKDKPRDLIHSDLVGPMQTTSYNNFHIF